MKFAKMTFARPISIALTAVALVGAGAALTAEAQLAQGHNSNAPVNFAADRIQVQDRADRVMLEGKVHVTQAELTIDAARIMVAYQNAGGVQVDRIDASGGVHITKGDQESTSDVAIYDLNSKVITLLGNVNLRQGTNRLTGGRAMMDLNSGLSTVDNRGTGGRVSGTFSVKKSQ